MTEPISVSLGMLKRVLVALEPRLFSRVVQDAYPQWRTGKGPPVETPRALQVKLCLADWMSHLGCLSDLQIVTALEKRSRQLKEWAAFVTPHLEGKIPPPGYTLTISDSHWAHSNVDQTWLDLNTGEELPALPHPAITHITCDVLALYTQALARLGRLGGKDVVTDSREGA